MINIIMGGKYITDSKKELYCNMITGRYAHGLIYIGNMATSVCIDLITGSILDYTGTYIDKYTPTQLDLLTQINQTCDCGGYKTYNSMSKEFHSNWCIINIRLNLKPIQYKREWSEL